LRIRNKKINILFFIIFLVISIFSFVNNNLDNTSYAFDENSDLLTVHFIDVSQGDSIFIELPNDEVMLIDAGEKDYGEIVSSYIDDLNYEKIDYVIGTHPHTDHIGGLSTVINDFEIKNIYMPKVTTNTKTFLNLLNTIDNKNLVINTAKSGVDIINTDDLLVTILSPILDNYEEINNYSVVLKIIYKDTSFLFTGDIESLVEKEILDEVDVDVIKIPHHGSDTSSSKDFVNSVSAKYGIIQVGNDNSYNHPHKKIVNRWENTGTMIYRNDLDGNIIVRSDGKSYDIWKEK